MSQKIALCDVLVLRDGWLWRKFLPNTLEVREEVLAALRAHPAVMGRLYLPFMGEGYCSHRCLAFYGSSDIPGVASVWAVVTEAQYEMLETHPDTVALLPFSLRAVGRFPGAFPAPRDGWFALGHVSWTSTIPDGVRWDYWG
jgi:hypothetical protein